MRFVKVALKFINYVGARENVLEVDVFDDPVDLRSDWLSNSCFSPNVSRSVDAVITRL